ncbi:hypothetical protein [Microbacterium sp. NPDC056569]|uniref:hypothetical protein n=1 Tax=Microbacterium sp. NPDC056569 TaxID=3345867 RepID=UPI00366C7F49
MATNEMWPAQMTDGVKSAASHARVSTTLDGPMIAAVAGLALVGAGLGILLQVPAVREAWGRALTNPSVRRAFLAEVEIVLRRCGGA